MLLLLQKSGDQLIYVLYGKDKQLLAYTVAYLSALWKPCK